MVFEGRFWSSWGSRRAWAASQLFARDSFNGCLASGSAPLLVRFRAKGMTGLRLLGFFFRFRLAACNDTGSKRHSAIDAEANDAVLAEI